MPTLTNLEPTNLAEYPKLQAFLNTFPDAIISDGIRMKMRAKAVESTYVLNFQDDDGELIVKEYSTLDYLIEKSYIAHIDAYLNSKQLLTNYEADNNYILETLNLMMKNWNGPKNEILDVRCILEFILSQKKQNKSHPVMEHVPLFIRRKLPTWIQTKEGVETEKLSKIFSYIVIQNDPALNSYLPEMLTIPLLIKTLSCSGFYQPELRRALRSAIQAQNREALVCMLSIPQFLEDLKKHEFYERTYEARYESQSIRVIPGTLGYTAERVKIYMDFSDIPFNEHLDLRTIARSIDPRIPGNFHDVSAFAQALLEQALNQSFRFILPDRKQSPLLNSFQMFVKNVKKMINSEGHIKSSVRALSDMMTQGMIPANTTLDLSRGNNPPKNPSNPDPGESLDKHDIQMLSEALVSGNAPTGLTLKLRKHHFQIPSITPLTDALVSGLCPNGLTVDISFNNWDGEWKTDWRDIPNIFKPFLKVMRSVNLPKQFTLIMGDTNWGQSEFFSAIGSLLSSGECAKNLTLKLFCGEREKLNALITALSFGKCPSGLTLELIGNLDTYDKKAILPMIYEQLSSGFCPEGLTLKISDTSCAKYRMQDLGERLVSGTFPAYLTLDFSSMILGNDEIDRLIKRIAPEADKLPLGLSLNFGLNASEEQTKQLAAICIAPLRSCVLLALLWKNCRGERDLFGVIYSYLRSTDESSRTLIDKAMNVRDKLTAPRQFFTPQLEMPAIEALNSANDGAQFKMDKTNL